MQTTAYPVVLIHGLGGWGEQDGIDTRLHYHYWGFDSKERDLLSHLRNRGYEVYAPSLGPFTSAWDRACELWAYLFGGRVDFGKHHSRIYGHKRFGRTYPGVLKDLGAPGSHAKLHLIGHSFGGPTGIVFADLLWRGSEEERAETAAEELSPLFSGGHDLLYSLVTLSGANNGTTFADFFGEKGMRFLSGAVFTANAVAGDTSLMGLLDFHTDQWGIMGPSVYCKNSLPRLREQLRGVKRLISNHLDNVGYELQVEYAAARNRDISLSPNTRYYAFRGCRTHANRKGLHVPDADMRRILKLWSTVIGRYRPEKLKPFGFDDTWLPSDGIVNVKCLGAPFGMESIDYTEAETVRPGIWYHMPIEDKHHMSWVGIGEDPLEFFSFFDSLLRRITAE